MSMWRRLAEVNLQSPAKGPHRGAPQSLVWNLDGELLLTGNFFLASPDSGSVQVPALFKSPG